MNHQILNKLINPKYKIISSDYTKSAYRIQCYIHGSIAHIVYRTNHIKIYNYYTNKINITHTISYNDPDYQIKLNNILDSFLDSLKHTLQTPQ